MNKCDTQEQTDQKMHSSHVAARVQQPS